MPVLLARPYPVHRLAFARAALEAATHGDVGPLQQLYRAARDALAALDPDEVDDFVADYPRAHRDDQGLAHAAVSLADTWEGLVAIGSQVRRLPDFRGFAWLAAQVRYELEPARRDAGRVRHYANGADLPDTEPMYGALYAALPALVGLGPELPDEIAEPCNLPGELVARLLGLPPDEEWTGIDPLDGTAISAETCRAHYAQASPAWRSILGRSLDHGMIVRAGEAPV